MSEERNLRLENAMATLAEISAQHDERLAAIERSNQRLEQTTQRLEQGFQSLIELAANQHERITGVERTTQMLADLAADHQQLMANLQRRVTGLEESQVMLVAMLRRQHDGVTEMRAAQANADAKIAFLAESQAHSDRKLDALIDIVRGGRNGQSENQPE
jgi:chromosome segregation ATPase